MISLKIVFWIWLQKGLAEVKADGDTFCDGAAARTALLPLAQLADGPSGGIRWKITWEACRGQDVTPGSCTLLHSQAKSGQSHGWPQAQSKQSQGELVSKLSAEVQRLNPQFCILMSVPQLTPTQSDTWNSSITSCWRWKVTQKHN